jgi:hypothetical protein
MKKVRGETCQAREGTGDEKLGCTKMQRSQWARISPLVEARFDQYS